MKMLLVSAVNKVHSRDLVLKPLGLAYIAAYLKAYGNYNDVQIVHGLQETKKALKDRPDVVAISSVTQNFNIAIEIAKAVKIYNRDIVVIVGGHHITALPECLTADMDIAVMGEGEQTMLELVQRIERGEPWQGTPGIAYREKSEIIRTRPREQINPLDNIPFPARHLLDIKPNEIYMFTSRGCPGRCPYCSSSLFWKTVRFHSPEYILQELRHIAVKYDPKSITIFDDLFIADKDRFRKIVELIEADGFNESISFSIQSRANLIDDEACDLLKRMNASVTCGFESGSPKILKILKNMDIKHNWNAVNKLRDHNIKFSGSFMVGIPGETIDDMDMTMQFVKNNSFAVAESYVLTPFPGTKMWDLAKSKGIVDDDMNWDKLNIDFKNNWRDAIILSGLNRSKLRERYSMLQDECERKAIAGKTISQIVNERGLLNMASAGIKNPRQAVFFIKNLINTKESNVT